MSELQLSKTEHKKLLAYSKECLEEFKQEGQEDLWYGIQFDHKGRMFDLNIYDGNFFGTEGTIGCTAYECIPSTDEGTDNWTTDKSKSLHMWEEKDEDI